MGLTHCPLNAKLDGLAVTGLSLCSVGTWAAPCSLGRRLPAEAAPEVTMVLQYHAATFLLDEVGVVAGAWARNDAYVRPATLVGIVDPDFLFSLESPLLLHVFFFLLRCRRGCVRRVCRQIWIAHLATVEGDGGRIATVGHRRVPVGGQGALELLCGAGLLDEVLYSLNARLGQAVALGIARRRELMDDALAVAEGFEFVAELWTTVRTYGLGPSELAEPPCEDVDHCGRCGRPQRLDDWIRRKTVNHDKIFYPSDLHEVDGDSFHWICGLALDAGDEWKTLAMLLAGLAGVDDGADVIGHVWPEVFAPGV
jgi:hypothetical protein